MLRNHPSVSIVLMGLFILSSFPRTGSEKLLFLIPMSTTSEKHVFEPIINGLALDGHHITVLTSTKSSNLLENVTEIIPFSVQDLFGEVITPPKFSNTFISKIIWDIPHMLTMCQRALNFNEFQPILKEKFDLVFTNLLFGQCFYGIIYKNESPFILLNSFALPNFYLKDLGSYVPTSIVPYPYLPYTDDMDFGQRLVNFVLDWVVYAESELIYIPLYERMYRGHLGQDIPSLKEIHRNVSLVMTNTHFTSTYHRPIMPDVVEIGGIHCKEAKPLPKELEDFVSASSEGFIYLSFGSVISASSLPQEMVQKFLNVFSKLKIRILWKFEMASKTNLPTNVMLSHWLPQQDLLGHSNIRLFISHGGLLSIQETIYHGVPSLLFPVWLDQMTNVENAVNQGYALSLDLWNFTEEELESYINRLLHDIKFKEEAKTISSIYRDRLKTPVEVAVFWTNYVLKYKGAPELRSSARNLNFIQFHSLDVIASLCTFTLILVFVLSFILRKVYSALVGVKVVVHVKSD